MFQIVVCSYLKNWDFMIQFDERIFQRGWFNHQLVTSVDVVPKSNAPTRRWCDSQAKYCFTCPEERTTHRYRFDTFRGSTCKIYIHIILKVFNHSKVNFLRRKNPRTYPGPNPLLPSLSIIPWICVSHALLNPIRRIRECRGYPDHECAQSLQGASERGELDPRFGDLEGAW